MLEAYEIKIKVKLLMDIQDAKLRLLMQVLSITENQESLLLSGDTSGELNVFFNGMSHEKQALIDEIIKADSLFQNSFNEVSADFEQFAQDNKEAVLALQESIKRVMDADVKIRVLEQRNRELATKRRKNTAIHIPKASKGYVLEQYKKNSGQTDGRKTH